MPAATPVRVHVRVTGTVQGVGFRPFVHRLAHEEGLHGHVLNDDRGVVIELEGERPAIGRLLERMRAEQPPLAEIDTVDERELPATGARSFEIRPSEHGAHADAVIAPDTATCAACLRELLDPTDRRHRYPFTNCTDCGPRLTIIDGVPYDRPRTTMAAFTMCLDCEREYHDPADRRFHAQPNACPACGPRVRLVDSGAGDLLFAGTADPLARAARLLADGRIVAIKGLGGYHLAADARNAEAVARLRARKHREHKPFALMVADLDRAAELIELGQTERELLRSPAAPIVLAPRRAGAGVAAAVAPDAPELGVMLAYTPLHHVLLHDLAALLPHPPVLVMTSGNVSDEPIAYDDAEALGRLAAIADAWLVHDRPIRTRVDDSVLRVVGQRADDGGAGGRMQMLRRSRGYVPTPLTLPVPAVRPLLACGAELKSTFCLASGRRAWLSHHIGDLEHFAARESFRQGIAHFEALLELEPEVVAHDLHPDYASTAYALERVGVEPIGVQHHHAHLAACLAEHDCDPSVEAVGAIFDGTGYGTDGTVWGGEILTGGLIGFERAASLVAVPLPGGAAAIREPWRMACAWVDAALGEGAALPAALAVHVDERRRRAIARVARYRSLSPLTSSMGRLFDAVAALCGLAPVVTYEGQAAVELTALVGREPPRQYEIPLLGAEGSAPGLQLDPRPLICSVVADLRAGVDRRAVAGGVHAAVAAATADLCARVAADAGLDLVVLSGGVYQNRPLLELTLERLEAVGLRTLTASRVPCNDGGVSFGQAAVAAARLATG